MIAALLLSVALAAPLPPPDAPAWSANPTMDLGLESAGACALVDGASLVLTGVGGAIGLGALFFAAIAACGGGGAAATFTTLLVVAAVGGVMAGVGVLGMAFCAPVAALAAAGYANYRNGRELWPLLVGAGAAGACMVAGLGVTVVGLAASSVCGPVGLVGPLALMLAGPLAVAGTVGADALFGSNVADQGAAPVPDVDAAPPDDAAPPQDVAPPTEPAPMDDLPPPPPLETPPAMLEPMRF